MKRLHFFTVLLAISLLFTQIPVCAQSFPVIQTVQFNCHFTAYACNTVSPWNIEKGMFYFKDSSFDGCKAGRYHIDTQFYLINCSFAE